MMRSLFSGVSGLRVHQNRMDVIGNNIANVNTVGFKASRMTFADAISQRIAGASADNPDTGRAGRNPMQIGLGVNVGGIDNIMTQGAAQRTDRPLDLTIQGDGFFIVGDANGTFFTRSGVVDWNGHTFSIGGMQLMGWPVDEPSPGDFQIRQGSVQPLTTPAETLFMPPRSTTMVEAIGNLNPREAELQVDGTRTVRRPIEFYDTLGNRYIKDVLFTYYPPVDETAASVTVGSTNTHGLWSFQFLNIDGDPAGDDGEIVVFPSGIPRQNADGTSNGIVVSLRIGAQPPATAGGPQTGGHQMGWLTFHPNGGHLMGVGYGAAPPAGIIPTGPGGTFPGDQPPTMVNLGIDTMGNPLFPPAIIGRPTNQIAVGGNQGIIEMDFSALRQNGGMRTTFQAMRRDGNAPGSLQDIMIGPDGIITGRYSNGDTRPLGQIPLAFFRNPAGLERAGNNLWIPTANSGWFDGVGGHGEMMPGTLEMSNVDLSSEFTEMITTQRGFQANSRVITTSDEMLQELVNLRR